MSGENDTPEPDRLPGAPHPRHAPRLFGQEAAEAAFLAAHNSGRRHHGWLIAGPRGVGKATLCWRIARFLLAQEAGPGGGLPFAEAPPPPASLDLAEDHPVTRRVAALSEGRLKLIRRGLNDQGRLRQVIGVEDVRVLRDFFGLSAPDGGERVVIVDAADEMNPNAANALLKLLEEPPPAATLLLVAHQPARLLPTIRSRCRTLALQPLSPAALEAALEGAGVALPEGGEAQALWALAAGSAGAAVELLEQGGLEAYAALCALLSRSPGLPRDAAIALAERAAGRGAEAQAALLRRLIGQLLSRAARSGAGHPPEAEAAPGEAALLARLAPDTAAARFWAEQAQELGQRAERAAGVNLDPAAMILDMLLRIDAGVARHARSPHPQASP